MMSDPTTPGTSGATPPSTVAVLGVGGMGAPMARRLADAGFRVRVWNRTRQRAAALADAGVVVADTPAEAAAGASVILTMLLDADATDAAMFGPDGAAAAAGPGTLWAQMGTVGVDGATRLAQAAAAHGLTLADAPVLGSRQPAAAGRLVVLAATPLTARAGFEPVFAAVGSRTLWVGEDPAEATASRLKLAINNWVLSLTAAVAESVALAEGLGLDPALFLAAIEGTPTDSPYAHLKGRQILAGDYAPAFTVAAAHKDAALIDEAAHAVGLTLPVATAVRAEFDAALRAGHGDLDMAAIHLEVRRRG